MLRRRPLQRPEIPSAPRPDSGFPERVEGGAADRVLAKVAEMAVTFARMGELDAARRTADEALALFGDAHHPLTIARASLDLGEALVMLGDPTCRELLEDAGTLFEDMGDEERVRRVDALLRTACAGIEESPRSFQARLPRR